MRNFLELTLGDGRRVDIPAHSIIFLEQLDDDAKATQPGCESGMFFDLGPASVEAENGPRAITCREAYDGLAAAVRGASPSMRIEVTSANGAKALIQAGAIMSIMELEQNVAGVKGKSRLFHLVGARLFPLDVLQTRDELRELMRAAMPVPIEIPMLPNGG